MESKKIYEREIALQDLYWKIILDWRQLLIFLVIFSILVPVSQYFMNQRTYNAAYADYRSRCQQFSQENRIL